MSEIVSILKSSGDRSKPIRRQVNCGCLCVMEFESTEAYQDWVIAHSKCCTFMKQYFYSMINAPYIEREKYGSPIDQYPSMSSSNSVISDLTEPRSKPSSPPIRVARILAARSSAIVTQVAPPTQAPVETPTFLPAQVYFLLK